MFERLAKDGVVDLVGRDKLAAIVNELALSAASRAADVKAGALLNANRLLFIEEKAPFPPA